MKFSTEVQLPEYTFEIDYRGKIFSIGSCFSDHVGQKLRRLKFNCVSNPAGILFNPVSIINQLMNALKQEAPNPNRIVERDGLYFHYDFHSQVYARSEEELMHKIYNINQGIREQLIQSDLCILTLGTSWVYEIQNKVVANCHKTPTKDFQRRLLDLNEMSASFIEFYEVLKSLNPNCHFLLTVSPIRHWKDGASENQVSKSNLHLLRYQLCERFDDVHYFPSYEIMMDELRDYRFYAEDLLHPTKIAFDHIWDNFSEALLHNKAKKLSLTVQKLLTGLEHKILYPEAQSHLKHLEYLKKEILALQKQSITLDEELTEVSTRIEKINKT